MNQLSPRDRNRRGTFASTALGTAAGEEAVEIFNTIRLSNANGTKREVAISKFEEYCTPKKDIT